MEHLPIPQKIRDEMRILDIAKGPDPRTDFAPSTFQSNVIWLLCFIALKLNKRG